MQRKTITVGQIRQLIVKYNAGKKLFRDAVGDTHGMKDLNDFNEKLKAKNATHPLTDEQVQVLITFLEARYKRVTTGWFSKDYRDDPRKLTNEIYVELAQLVADYWADPKILSYVQYFKNDYGPNKMLLFKHEPSEKIFITSELYAIPLSDLAMQIKEKGIQMYRVYNKQGSSEAVVTFSDEDKLKFKEFPEILAAISTNPSAQSDYDLFKMQKDIKPQIAL